MHEPEDTQAALARLLQAFAKRGELSAELDSVTIEVARARGELAALRARDALDAARAKAAVDAATANSIAPSAAGDGSPPSIQ